VQPLEVRDRRNRPMAAARTGVPDEAAAGIGLLLGLFLLVDGWENGLIGTDTAIGGVVGMVMATGFIDTCTASRWQKDRARSQCLNCDPVDPLKTEQATGWLKDELRNFRAGHGFSTKTDLGTI
jgi:hypothetical protein